MGNAAVSPNAGITANEDVLLHLAAVAQTDTSASVNVVTRVSAAPFLLVREVGLRSEWVKPPPHEVRRHRVVHKEVGHSDSVAIVDDIHVYVVSQDLR